MGWNLTFPPGGGAGPNSSPFEKVYACLVGSVTVIVDSVEFVLNPMKFLHSRAERVREIIDRQNHVATTLIVMPYPPARERGEQIVQDGR